MKRATRTRRQLPTTVQWLLSVAALLLVGMVWWGLLRGSGAPALPPYTITRPEAYGNPGLKVGNKFSLVVEQGTPEATIREIVRREADANRERKAIYGEGLRAVGFQPEELTFFIFTTRQPGGKEVADYVYEWHRGLGVTLTICPLPVVTDCKEDP